MAWAPPSSSVLTRSVIDPLSSRTQELSEEQQTATGDISALPFILNQLQSTWNNFLHFGPGAFSRRGVPLGGGTTFSVEKHSLNGIRGSLMVDPFSSASDRTHHEVVAVKKVRQISTSPDYVFRSIERDLLVLQRLHGAKNILELIGVGWEPSPIRGDSRLWPVMVTELADMGNLELLQRKMGSLHYHTKRKFCLDVANGLSALHQARMAHGDVKAENVLVFSDPEEGYIAKLSDFAFSGTVAQLQVGIKTPSFLDNDYLFRVVGATALWAPPEFRSPGTLSSLATRDVYSWAMLVIRVMMDGKFPPEDLRLEDEGAVGNSFEDPCLRSPLPTFGASLKATLERRPHNSDVRAHLPDLRKDARERLDSSHVQNISLESETPQSSVEGLNLLKAKGKESLISYCVKLMRRSGESDVRGDLARLERVLDACLDVDPGKRSLDVAVRAWSERRTNSRRSSPYEGPVNNYYPLDYPFFSQWPLRLQSQFLASFKATLESESPYPAENVKFCPIRSMSMMCAQAALDREGLEDILACTTLITTQAQKGDPYSMALEEPLTKVLSKVFGYNALEKSNDQTRMTLVRLITALRAGSRAAQRSFLERPGASQQAIADLLRDTLAAQYHGTRGPTRILSAMQGTREESDLALIRSMAALSRTRDALAAWINKSTYPGEDLHERMLHIACSRGFDQVVCYLVENGGDVNAEDDLGETPLLHACRAGRTSVVRYLLRQGATVRPCGPRKETPLHWLCSFPPEHMSDMIELLLTAGADINAMALHSAATGDSMERQQFSFAAGTPLHRAVSRQSYRAVDLLLDSGANPLQQSPFAPFYSPLSLACSMNLSLDSSAPHIPVPSLSIEQVQPASKGSAFGLVGSRRCVDIARAAHYTSSDLVSGTSILKRLLEGCNIKDMNRLHLKPFNGRRLLSIALNNDPLLRVSIDVEHWRLACRQTVRLLWLFGEDLIDRQAGFSSLHLACEAGNFEVGDEIIRLVPASINEIMPGSSTFLQTPLHYAVRGGHERVIKLLLDKGADPTQRFMTDLVYTGTAPTSDIWFMWESDEFDRSKMIGRRSTLLHTCASVGSAPNIVKDLIGRGVKVNSYDSNWQSPLFLAIRACNFEVADVLLEHGARLNELRDDLTIFGQLAEDGFSSPIASFEYIINKLKPLDSAAFMANFKQSFTVFHKLMESEGSQRNQAWAEELILLFLRNMPDKRILDVQADGTAETALHVAIRNNNLLGVRLLLDAGADPNIPDCHEGTPLDLANKLRPQLLSEFPQDIMDDPAAVAEYEFRRSMIAKAILAKGGKWLRDPSKMFASRLFAGMKTISPRIVESLGEEKYSMPRWASDGWFKLRSELGVDLKTVNAKATYYEGAIREIVEDIVADLKPLFSDRLPEFMRNPQDAVVQVLRKHLSETPEIFHRRLRIFRFESQMAWELSGFSGFSVSFDSADMSVAIEVPLEEDGSGEVGIPNLLKRGGLSYEQGTKGTRMIVFPRGAGGGVSYTTALEDGEDSMEQIFALMKKMSATD